MTDRKPDFSGLKALFINTTLTRSPEESHTQRLIDVSVSIMRKNGVEVDQFRSVDHDIATGIHPDMRAWLGGGRMAEPLPPCHGR